MMLPIATSHKDCGEKEQGFAEENTTPIDQGSLVVGCGDFVVQIHKRRECTVLTLSFLEQAYTFAVGEQKDKQMDFH